MASTSRQLTFKSRTFPGLEQVFMKILTFPGPGGTHVKFPDFPQFPGTMDKREHRNMLAMFLWPASRYVLCPHFFLCILLQVYPVRSPFKHHHVSQRLSYPFPDSSLERPFLCATCPMISLLLAIHSHDPC